MGWTYCTRYGPASAHEGYSAAVVNEDIDVSAHAATQHACVIGWRPACTCGWHGTQLWTHEHDPGKSRIAPEEVGGLDCGCEMYAEWLEYLHTALPLLAVHDAIERVTAARVELDQAVNHARRAKISWSAIASVVGKIKQSAHSRCGATYAGQPVSVHLPASPTDSALSAALRAQVRGATLGFAVTDLEAAYSDVEQELAEMRQTPTGAEAGDVLFAAVQVARQLGVDPDEVLSLATSRYEARLDYVAEHARTGPATSPLERREWWTRAKRAVG